MVKKIAIIQARLSSSRLPGKLMKSLCGKTLLERVIEKVKQSDIVDEIWLATSIEQSDDILELVAIENSINIFRGSLNNVLDRFCNVVQKSNADIVVRVTADNPLTEPIFITEGINELLKREVDYVSYEQIPYGSGVEIINSESLMKALRNTDNEEDLEHVTLFIRKNPEMFKIKTLTPIHKLKRPEINVTIDTLEDYTQMYKLFYECGHKRGRSTVSLIDAINYFDKKN